MSRVVKTFSASRNRREARRIVGKAEKSSGRSGFTVSLLTASATFGLFADAGRSFLQGLAKAYHGMYRRVKQLR